MSATEPAAAATATAASGSDQSSLTDYFWKITVAALANDLPPPKLDFYFDGFRAFSLQAEEDEFLLLDFEEVAEANCASQRGLSLRLEDDESAASTGHVFGESFVGTRDSIDDAIELVAAFYSQRDVWHRRLHGEHVAAAANVPQMFDAVIARARIACDGVTFETDRRYVNVLQQRGKTLHVPVRQSDRAAQLETLGHATLTWLRVLRHWLGARAAGN